MNILIFGPNGSGKGTQSSALKKKHDLEHIESGGIFRENIKNATELGKKAKAYIDRGELVPDSITIPMILDRLGRAKKSWILDGFPRNPSQARALYEGLKEADIALNAVIVIELPRETAKSRLMGRRSCPDGHPNNTAIDVIAPKEENHQLLCWKCNKPVSVRSDDIDEKAIDIRLNIYFDSDNGTVGSIDALKEMAKEDTSVKFIHVDGKADIQTVTQAIDKELEC
ncbi:MAG: adenylate kinase [Acidobacteria bacterium]|nr:MAG: adenylate kinase [Acidobacteriota bacterium]